MKTIEAIGMNYLGRGTRNWMLALAAGLSGSAAMAQPNVEVRINGAIQAPNQEFVFDSTDVGESTPLIVVVRNVGFENLEFPSAAPIFLGGGFAGQFTLIQPALETGNILSPNGSTAFRVDFAPTIAKHFMPAQVSIPTNDPDTPIFNLNLRGVVPVPQMVISRNGQIITPQSQVNVPATPIGQSSELEVTIANEGERPLVLTDPLETFGGFGSGAFSVEQPPLDTLQPNESTTFVVVFAPTQTGSVTSNVGISSNDVGNLPNGRFTFVVRGIGQPAEDNGGDTDDDGSGGDNGGGDVGDGDDDGGNNGGGVDDGGQDNGGQSDGGIDDGTPDNGHQPIDDAGDDDAAQDNPAGNTDDTTNESSDVVTDEVLKPMGICGFGAPLGLACCLASLAAGRITRRRRNR